MRTEAARLPSVLPEIAGIILCLVIAGLVALGIQYRREVTWVQHTLEVQTALARLGATFERAQVGQQGYLLTGEEAFLEPWNRAMGDIDTDLATARRLIVDNPMQVAELVELKSIMDDRLAFAKARIDERRAGDTEGALKEVLTQHGLRLSQEFERKLADMTSTEEHLLAGRLGVLKRTIRVLALAALFGLALAVGAVTYWISKSRRDARDLAAAHERYVATVTERERVEAQLRQAQKMEAVGQLTGGIAHDFNNALTVILSGLNLIRTRVAHAEVAQLLDACSDAANRAATLIRRLLAFARQQPLSPQPLDANRLLAGMGQLMGRTLGETIEIETVLAAGLWMIHADANQLESALLNMCLNARDAMPEGGKLTIETQNGHLDGAYAAAHDMAPGQYVLIAVTDTGSGMTPEVVARAFDPFFTTKDVGKGSGLGLSQVYGFVKQTGGHIKIYSEPPHGSTVKIYLPRFHETSADRAQPRAAEKSARADGKASETILVVEDEPRVLEMTVSALRDFGYSVVAASGGAEALRLLDANPNTLLLFTDVVMPHMNGRKLAEEAVKRNPALKVIFTTGFTRNAVVHNGVLDHDVHFLAKPFTIEELAGKVRAVLDGTSPPYSDASPSTVAKASASIAYED